MRRMLEELYYGNIDPNNQDDITGTQYAEAMKTISETEEKLLKLLDGTEKSLFIENAGAQSEVIAIIRWRSSSQASGSAQGWRRRCLETGTHT